MIALLLFAQSLSGPEAEVRFAARRTFPDAAACRAELSAMAAAARGKAGAVEGPHPLPADTWGLHRVDAEGRGHRITESRCVGAELSERSWKHEMRPAGAEPSPDADAGSPFSFERVFGEAPRAPPAEPRQP